MEEFLSTLQIGAKPKGNLERARELIAEAAALLEEVDRDFVPLVLRRRDRPLSDCRAVWAALPAGRLPAKEPPVKSLIDKSPTLSTMYRGGLNFIDFCRFAKEDLDRASVIAELFDSRHPYWDEFRTAVTQNRPWIKFSPTFEVAPAVQIATLLRAGGILETFRCEVFVKRDSTWAAIDDKKARALLEKFRVRLMFALAPVPQLTTLVSGDWLTAVSLKIVADHLERNDFDFEVYSKVGYETAEGLRKVRGDFDLLVRSHQKVLAVECKSGRLDASRGDFEEMAAKAERLSQVFALNQAGIELTYWLVFNHHLNDRDEIQSRLKGTRLEGLTLEELRGKVITQFGATRTAG
ncbi:MAG: hypothetical protein V4550_11935 [Gemmatimonadota bacterium]